MSAKVLKVKVERNCWFLFALLINLWSVNASVLNCVGSDSFCNRPELKYFPIPTGSKSLTLHLKVPKKSNPFSSSGWKMRKEGSEVNNPCHKLLLTSFPHSRFKMGDSPLTDFMGVETSKKRKRRTSFTPHALEILNSSFERNTHPSGECRRPQTCQWTYNFSTGTDITALAQALGYEREVIRIWFCNKRQALKNTVRMMSKGMPN